MTGLIYPYQLLDAQRLWYLLNWPLDDATHSTEVSGECNKV